MKKKLDTHCPYMTTYRMYKDCKRKLKFPLAVAYLLSNLKIVARAERSFVAMWRAIWTRGILNGLS